MNRAQLNAIGLQYRNEIAQQLYLSATIRHDENDQFQDADTYSLSAAWQIPGTGTRLHTSYGTGVTAPTFIEQFGFIPRPSSATQTSCPKNPSAGMSASNRQSSMTRSSSISPISKSDLENEIFTDFLPTFKTTPLNSTSDSDRSGWELYVSATPMDGLSLYGAYTSSTPPNPPASKSAARKSKPPSTPAGASSARPCSSISASPTFGDNVDTDFATFLRTDLDPYTLIRLGASWQVDDQIELYTRVENLTDEDYQEVIGYNAAPQAVYVGLRFRDEAASETLLGAICNAAPPSSPLWGGGRVVGAASVSRRERVTATPTSRLLNRPPHPTLSPQGGEGRFPAVFHACLLRNACAWLHSKPTPNPNASSR